MRVIPILILTFLLLACSQAGPGGGAVGGVGGAGESTAGGPLGGPGAAAQPLDAGFSGPKKDVESLGYVIREAKGRVVCKEANGDVNVKLSGVVFSKQTGYAYAGYLRISDLTAQRFLVTQVANDEEVGNFSTTMLLRLPFQLSFTVPVTGSEVSLLDTLLPIGEGILFGVSAPPEPELIIEGASDPQHCLSAEPQDNAIEKVDGRPQPQLAN